MIGSLKNQKNALFEKIAEMDSGQRSLMFILCGVVTVFGVIRIYDINSNSPSKPKASITTAGKGGGVTIVQQEDVNLPNNNTIRTLPQNTRNTGLDDLALRVGEQELLLKKLTSQLEAANAAKGAAANNSGNIYVPSGANYTPPNLDTPLPGMGASANVPQIDTQQLKRLDSDIAKGTQDGEMVASPTIGTSEFTVVRAQKRIKSSSTEEVPPLAIPRGSVIDTVLLTGIDAFVDNTGQKSKPNLTGKGSSATVQTPFIAKIKGDALMANGWRNTSLSECTIMGTAMGNLSTERAYLTTSAITCISEKGEIYEGDLESVAFGPDGKPGIAGKVVSKTGQLLMKSFLGSAVGGFASVLTPQPVNSFNSVATGSGTQKYQWPDPQYATQSALGAGFQKTGEMLAQFYLDYAKQMLPAIEVIGGQRVSFGLSKTLVVSKFIVK